jgi:hypothetical protein
MYLERGWLLDYHEDANCNGKRDRQSSMEKSQLVSRDLKRLLVAGGIFAGIFCLLWQVSPAACAIVLFELPYLAGILLAALALGYLPVKLLGGPLPLGQKIIIALGCGLGFLSLIVMGVGLVGFLQAKILWLALIGGLAVVGAVLLYRNFQKAKSGEQVLFEAGRFWLVLLAALIPFLILVLLCAAIPPGVLWSGEGYGYDILEYHLQVPKEWFQAGKIGFLGHNVYANFPSNAEMLYLLAMAMKGDPYQAVYLAQMIHVSFAILLVAGIWVFVRPAGLKSACFAAVTAGTCGWMAYLSPLAYVEMGMLFMGVLALGLLWRMREEEVPHPIRYGMLIGLLLGLCGGFKYTALAMIAGPVMVAGVFFFIRRVGLTKGILAEVAMGGMCLAAISPYFLRNIAWTGNPVFPLASSYFGGRDWDETSARRWAVGHSVREDERPLKARLERLYWCGLRNIGADSFLAEYYKSHGQFNKVKEIFNPSPIMDLPQFGLAVLILPWLVFLTRRQGLSDWLLVLIFLLQTVVWLFATHLQARFLVPWLVVLPFLAGRSAQVYGRGRFSIGMILMTVIVLGAVGLNFEDAYRRYLRHTTVEGNPINWFGQENAFLEGKIPGLEYLETVNKNPEAKTLLLGDAKAFYVRGPAIYWTVFNHNDFAAAAAKGAHEAKNYIAEVKPGYIYVDWGEVGRLKSTYGFDESIKPSLLMYLTSPDRFYVRPAGKWGLIPQAKQWRRVLYQVTYKTPKEKKVGQPHPVR